MFVYRVCTLALRELPAIVNYKYTPKVGRTRARRERRLFVAAAVCKRRIANVITQNSFPKAS